MSSRLRSALVRHRVAAGVEHRAIFSNPFATVVDIGANRGQFALAARAFGCGRVYSFEPLPGPASVFRNLFANDLAVILHMTAIGEKAEIKSIHLSARDDSSSLLEIGKSQIDYFPGTHEVGRQEVEVGRLDQYISKADIIRPALLKLDVQGYEMEALSGCLELIHNFDYIYCECSFVELYKGQKLAGDIVTFLSDIGFRLAGIYNPAYETKGHCIQADMLFTRFKGT